MNNLLLQGCADKLHNSCKELTVAIAALRSFDCTELGNALEYTRGDIIEVAELLERRFAENEEEAQ